MYKIFFKKPYAITSITIESNSLFNAMKTLTYIIGENDVNTTISHVEQIITI